MVKTFKIEWIEENLFDDFNNLGWQQNILEEEEESDMSESELEELAMNSDLKHHKITTIGCFIHLLQCISVHDKEYFSANWKKATKLMNKFRQSGKLAESLKLKSGSLYQ